MRIIAVGIYHFNKAFKFRFHSSQASRASADSVIIQLDFENGISGYGESAPRPYVTGENCSTVSTLIKERFCPLLFFHEIESLEDVEDALNGLESECLRKGISDYNSALGAIDIALLDAVGKFQKSPLVSFLGPTVRKKIPYSISIPFLPLEKIRELYLQLQKPRFKHVKVLVGDIESENIERVGLVRALFGDRVNIRLEANGKWTFQQAVSNLEKLKKFSITAVEQPVAKNDVESLQRLRRAIDIPIIADESVCCLSDAKNLIERNACDILSIKISKCGGLLRSKRIAQFAESQNMPCQLGAHVGETEILDTAGKSFALTTPNLIYFEGYSFLLFPDAWRKGQFESINGTDRGSGFGLGLKLANQKEIMKYCSLITEIRA